MRVRPGGGRRRISRARLVSLVARCLDVPAQDLDVRQPLARYGLDSLAAAELAAALRAAVGCELPESLLLDCPNIVSLERALAGGEDPAGPPAAALAQMLDDAVLPREIRPPAVAPSPDPVRAVLLTGATGFLGAYLLQALLRDTSAHVHCLVRAATEEDGRRRVREGLDRYGLRGRGVAARFSVVTGDVSQPRLGLSPRRFDALGREIGAIYHAAAAVNWVLPYAALRNVNVLGTRELLRLACRVQPKPLHFVSSLAVAYSTAGPREVSEVDDPLPFLPGIHLGYAQTKCVAEALVRQAAERGLPVTIFRPALVSGDARSGVSNSEDVLARLIKGCLQLGCAPDLDWVLDCCPVDFVADAIVRLARTRDRGLRVFHLANPRPRHWREGVLWMNLFGYPIRLVPYSDWLQRVAAAADAPGFALGPLAPFFLRRLAGAGGLTLPELYQESRRSRARAEQSRLALAQLGIACPSLDAGLLDRYFAAFIAGGFLPPAPRVMRPVRSVTPVRLDTSFFTAVLRRFYRDDALQVTHVTAVGDGADHSILGELTSWRSRCATGLFRYRLDLAPGREGTPGALDVAVKVKPEDREILDAGEAVARLCGASLGRAYARARQWLGVAGCHRRELAVYAQEDARFRRHTPVVYGRILDDRRRAWVLVLEDLSDLVLLDTADDVRDWRQEHIEAAIRGLAELHAVWYGREAELLQQPWLGPVTSAGHRRETQELWTALADHAAPYFAEWVGGCVPARQRELIAGLGHRWRTLQAMPRTLIHNDFNPRNLALRRSDGGFILCAYDWELAALGVPQHDLAEFLCFVLTADFPPEAMEHYLELHRATLERATRRPVDATIWRRGFQFALDDLLVDRLSMYALVHRFRRQPFLPRVLRTWWALSECWAAGTASAAG